MAIGESFNSSEEAYHFMVKQSLVGIDLEGFKKTVQHIVPGRFT